MKKVELLPTWDREAGYAPGCKTWSIVYTHLWNLPRESIHFTRVWSKTEQVILHLTNDPS